ncbi:hypothetical protein XU18_5230 [Perkinsela sp. CCAP 1560/4]|nr:hypothetical protein XU18_5230 [Perkinsela sp. CCAP 1560/4]|eukprot:KNH00553.1 hypothetical protein XU18_5230 [Perkinsela sp. CCAP 1560/4]
MHEGMYLSKREYDGGIRSILQTSGTKDDFWSFMKGLLQQIPLEKEHVKSKQRVFVLDGTREHGPSEQNRKGIAIKFHMAFHQQLGGSTQWRLLPRTHMEAAPKSEESYKVELGALRLKMTFIQFP